VKRRAEDPIDTGSKIRDEMVASDIRRALRWSGYANALREVSVEVHAGCVVLSGRLPQYHLKQVAQAAAMKVRGVVRVKNDVQVY